MPENLAPSGNRPLDRCRVGQMAWGEVRTVLAGASASWQDLDGFHLEAIPDTQPPTSILWAWRHGETETQAWVVRIDRATILVASADVPTEAWRPLLAWKDNEGQVRQARFATGAAVARLSDLEALYWREPVHDGRVPLMFICHRDV